MPRPSHPACDECRYASPSRCPCEILTTPATPATAGQHVPYRDEVIRAAWRTMQAGNAFRDFINQHAGGVYLHDGRVLHLERLDMDRQPGLLDLELNQLRWDLGARPKGARPKQQEVAP